MVELKQVAGAFAAVLACGGLALAEAPSVELDENESAGTLTVRIDGEEALTYQFAEEFAIPHYYPVRSPSGHLLTDQVPDPWPHHRSFWIADKVQLEGEEEVDFYHMFLNYVEEDAPESGYRHYIEHQGFTRTEAEGDTATVASEAQWLIDGERPALDEHRELRVTALGDGEYLMDLSWELVAAHGDVQVTSDWIHYGWPFIRMHPQFSGEEGGAITADDGRTGQAETDHEYADWIDYSNTVEGDTEGVAVFIYPDGEQRRWLTREYGTFGPRRPDALSGTQFTLEEGDSLTGRVGILIHRGDVETGEVAERYRQYAEGEL